jgi:hypothetical protein
LGFINQSGVCNVATTLPYSVTILELLVAAISYIGIAGGGFFLYRSAKSLVPMNKRAPVELKNLDK